MSKTEVLPYKEPSTELVESTALAEDIREDIRKYYYGERVPMQIDEFYKKVIKRLHEIMVQKGLIKNTIGEA